jgi:uncharacterized protein YeaO (DUF488 family)
MRGDVEIARVYGLQEQPGSHYVLVDRLWPRGISKKDAPFDEWLKDVAPSTELRKSYGHIPERFDEFSRAYRHELADGAAHRAFEHLSGCAETGGLVLVTATKDIQHSEAAVLKELLDGR